MEPRSTLSIHRTEMLQELPEPKDYNLARSYFPTPIAGWGRMEGLKILNYCKY